MSRIELEITLFKNLFLILFPLCIPDTIMYSLVGSQTCLLSFITGLIIFERESITSVLGNMWSLAVVRMKYASTYK